MKNELISEGFKVKELEEAESKNVDVGNPLITWGGRAAVALVAWAAKDAIDNWDHFKAGLFLSPQPAK